MGEFSIKGPLVTVSHLPCAECETKPCCRKGNGVDVHHSSEFITEVDGVRIGYLKNGDCQHLTKGRCGIQSNKPHACAVFDCSRDTLFRSLHPQVDVLLTSRGL